MSRRSNTLTRRQLLQEPGLARQALSCAGLAAAFAAASRCCRCCCRRLALYTWQHSGTRSSRDSEGTSTCARLLEAAD
jgi:hypothetical protein